ncbi:MAG: hypothetical protein K8R46_02595 [Pirellulales bacterium]|nr:hypothetical protein [Pirellulales bacterium]
MLFAKLLMPKLPMQPQRVVFFVPLVGAGAGQQLMTVRNFSRRGAIVISYEYRGHPQSTGKFDLDCTIADTHHALIWALNYANELGLPLHGFATCYGVVPLLAQFQKGGCGHLLRSINTTSGLYHLNQILRIEDFAPIVSRYLGRELDAPSLLAEIAEEVLDCDGHAFKQALREYLSELMPDLRIGLDYFEELNYERVKRRQALLQFSRSDYLDGVNVPPWIPCTAYIGLQDELLFARASANRETYKNYVLSVVPHATVRELEMDHYGRGPDHDPVIEYVGDDFERSDTSPVPPRHVYKAPHYQNAPR